MLISEARLRSDLARWQAAGWVSDAGAVAIRRDLDARRPAGGLYGALAILGAILLAAAGMSFVAAHWDQMSKLARLSLLGGGILASYAAAYALFQRRLDAFAHAAVLVGVGLFGGSIMLIAQMYHMDGNPPDAVWLWSVGALAAGLLLRSNPALAAGALLVALWSAMTIGQDPQYIHWAFLPMWAVAAAGVANTRWRTGMHLLALILSGWIIASCLIDGHNAGRWLLACIGLGACGAAVFGGDRIDRWRAISGTMLAHGMVLTYAGLFAIQFFDRVWTTQRSGAELWLWGGVTLALLVGAMAAAWRTSNLRVLWLAYALFSVEIFALYIAKVGSLLGTSAFFFVTGLLLIALATLAYRMRNQMPDAERTAS